jgi:hypothetical protein
VAQLTLTQGGVEHKVYQYAMPIKGRDIYLRINSFEVAGKVTAARGRTYTYFVYAGGEFYVAGELGAAPCSMSVPDGFEPKVHVGRVAQYAVIKEKRAAARAAALAAGTVPEPKKRGRKAKEPAAQPAA